MACVADWFGEEVFLSEFDGDGSAEAGSGHACCEGVWGVVGGIAFQIWSHDVDLWSGFVVVIEMNYRIFIFSKLPRM